MVDGQIRALGKGDAEQAARRCRTPPATMLSRTKYGFTSASSSVVLRLPDLLGVIAPVPRLDRLVQSFGRAPSLSSAASSARAFALAGSQTCSSRRSTAVGGLGHRIVEPVIGEIVVAEEPRLLGAQRHDFADRAAHCRCAPGCVPRAVHASHKVRRRSRRDEKVRKRLDRGAREGDDIAPSMPRSSAACGRGGAGESRKPVEVRSRRAPAANPARRAAHSGRTACAGSPAARRSPPCAPSARRQQRPAAHEAQVIALEQPQLVRGQPERLASWHEGRRSARTDVGVESDAHLVLGELRRVVAGDRFERLVGVARIEIVEHPADPVEQTTAALQRLDRIGKARRPRRSRRSRRSRQSARPCCGRRPAGNARAECGRTAAGRTAWSRFRRTGFRSFGFLDRISSIIAYDQGRVARRARDLATAAACSTTRSTTLTAGWLPHRGRLAGPRI